MGRALSDDELATLRSELAAGNTPTVWFTGEAVGVTEGRSGKVMDLGEPAEGDFIQVRPAGSKDVLSFSAGEVTTERPSRKRSANTGGDSGRSGSAGSSGSSAPGKAASAGRSATSSGTRGSGASGAAGGKAAASGSGTTSGGEASSADRSASGGAAQRSSGGAAKRTAPVSSAPASSGPASSGPASSGPASAGASPASSTTSARSGQRTGAQSKSSAEKSGGQERGGSGGGSGTGSGQRRQRSTPGAVVTLTADAEGQWHVEVTSGKKRVLRATPVPPSAVAQAAHALHDDVAAAVEPVLEAARERQRARVEQLQQELDSARRLLEDLDGQQG
ncbi:DUF6319 family protein [Bounagaea algeriensis]